MVETVGADFQTVVLRLRDCVVASGLFFKALTVIPMKKWVIFLFIGLALIVLISPGLIGNLAERSVDENLRVGTIDTEDLVVSALAFDRGWFTTEGRHRLELKEGSLAEQYRDFFSMPADAPLPVLIINTRIDHGLFPVASMSREDGSLAPGLGDAVSTLQLEMPDGEIVDVPGAINSSIGLTGTMRSVYELPAGAFDDAGEGIRWGAGRIEVETHPANGRIRFDAELESMDMLDGGGPFQLSGLSVKGFQLPSSFGFPLGKMTARIDTVSSDGFAAGPYVVSGGGRIDDDLLALDFSIDVSSVSALAGEADARIRLEASGVDPDAFGKLVRRYRIVRDQAGDSNELFKLLETELGALAAHGLAVNVRQLELGFPDGALQASAEIDVAGNDASVGSWSPLVLATNGSATIRVPATLMDMFVAMNPEVGAAIGMGYFRQDGDAFVTDIRYAKGILTINDAPMAIPLALP